MAASYPTSIWAPTTKVDNVDDILASHMNDVQAEVVAIETSIITGPFKPAKINSPDATALLFRNNADNAELMRLTNAGILALGTTMLTSASAGDIVIPNAKRIRGVNSGGTNAGAMIGVGSNADLTLGDTNTTAFILNGTSIGTDKVVTVGALDSGGTGYKLLRVPN